MKKILLAAAALLIAASGCRTGQSRPHAGTEIEKTTFAYAIKGDDTLRLDRYQIRNAPDGARPCLLFVFGGGFVSGSRDHETYLPFFRHLADRGITVVSIDYRLGLKKALEAGTLTADRMLSLFPETISDAVEDLFSATGYLLAHAEEWGIDPSRIIACGSSAGAITVLQGEHALRNGSANPLEGFDYAGVISFAGAILGQGDDLAWAEKPAPILLFHGDADANVPYGTIRTAGFGFFGSEYLAAQFEQAQTPFWFYSVAGADHSMATRPMEENRSEIDTFIDRFVLGREPLMIRTDLRTIGTAYIRPDYRMEDYIRANFAH